jgi:FecR protein
MKKLKFPAILVVALTSLAAIGVIAQERTRTAGVSDKYLISAKAGGVNLTEGKVSVIRADATSDMVLKGDQIDVGEKLSTGANGRVEILLNPGSYLRLGPNSTAEFKTTSLDDLQIKLDSGSAMFEVFASKEFTVSVFTPKGLTKLVESGVYRFDIAADGSAVVSVTEGKAMVGTTTVKEGRTGTIDGNAKVAIAKFDRDKRDDLAQWSRTRAKVLSAMTASLRNRDVRNTLMSSFVMGRWGIMDSFGLWVLNPRFGTYCFLPFGYGWYSPYGYGYGPGIWWYNLPPIVYNPPVVGQPNTTRAGSGIVKPPAQQIRPIDPPFTKVRDRDVVRTSLKNDFPGDTSSPTRNSPPPPPVITVAPTVRGDSKKPGN